MVRPIMSGKGKSSYQSNSGPILNPEVFWDNKFSLANIYVARNPYTGIKLNSWPIESPIKKELIYFPNPRNYTLYLTIGLPTMQGGKK